MAMKNSPPRVLIHERDPGRRREDQDFWVWEFQRTHQASPLRIPLIPATRKGRNPKTGEEIVISGRKVVTFKPSFVLRKALNKPE